MTPLGQLVQRPATQMSLALGQHWAAQTTPLGQAAAAIERIPPNPPRAAPMPPPRARRIWRRLLVVAMTRVSASNRLLSMGILRRAHRAHHVARRPARV